MATFQLFFFQSGRSKDLSASLYSEARFGLSVKLKNLFCDRKDVLVFFLLLFIKNDLERDSSLGVLSCHCGVNSLIYAALLNEDAV